MVINESSDHLRAMRMQIAKKNLDFDKELMDTVDRLYEKYVLNALKNLSQNKF